MHNYDDGQHQWCIQWLQGPRQGLGLEALQPSLLHPHSEQLSPKGVGFFFFRELRFLFTNVSIPGNITLKKHDIFNISKGRFRRHNFDLRLSHATCSSHDLRAIVAGFWNMFQNPTTFFELYATVLGSCEVDSHVSYGWREQVACASCKSKFCPLNRTQCISSHLVNQNSFRMLTGSCSAVPG